VKPIDNITLEKLKEVLSYDPESGFFTWAQRGHGRSLSKPAGCIDPHSGYRVIAIDRVDYYAQRLAWLWIHGKLPTRTMKFQNGDRADCRISNLSEGRYLRTKHDFTTKEGKHAYDKEHRALNREKYANKHREKTYGLTLADYSALIAAQDNKCAICRQPETATRNGRVKALAIDHCHATGEIRQLLCVACNTGLGKFKDDRNLMLAAIKYLDKYSGREQVAAKLELVRKEQ
jgi:hypothetical protein